MAKCQNGTGDIAFPPKGIRKPKTYVSEGEASYEDRFAARGRRFRRAKPEEYVRQKFLKFLQRDVGVPDDMLKTEDAVSHHARSGTGRADIVGLAPSKDSPGGKKPLFVVECKKLDWPLDDDVKRQVLRYARRLDVRFALTTNGKELNAYQIAGRRLDPLAATPSYDEMLNDRVRARSAQVAWVRPKYPKLVRMSMDEIDSDERLCGCMGSSTPDGVAELAVELAGLLLDDGEAPGRWNARGIKMSSRGLGHVTPRNPSGGRGWGGMYRQWLVQGRANARLVSLAVKGAWNGKTMLMVATDQQGRTGNVLQLSLDDFVALEGNRARIFHNGRMRGGVKGASKAAMIDWLRNEAPHLLDGEGNVDLGVLPVGRRQNWRDARRLVLRCVEYGFAREAFMRAHTGPTTSVN